MSSKWSEGLRTALTLRLGLWYAALFAISAAVLLSFTYLLLYKEQADAQKGKALAKFLWWALHDGQKLAAALDYAPLPPALVPKIEATIKSITIAGKSALAER